MSIPELDDVIVINSDVVVSTRPSFHRSDCCLSSTRGETVAVPEAEIRWQISLKIQSFRFQLKMVPSPLCMLSSVLQRCLYPSHTAANLGLSPYKDFPLLLYAVAHCSNGTFCAQESGAFVSGRRVTEHRKHHKGGRPKMTWLVVYFMLEQERQRPETSLHTQCVRVGTWPF